MPIANNGPSVYPNSPAALTFPFLSRPSLCLFFFFFFFVLASTVCLSLLTRIQLYLSTRDNDFRLAFSVGNRAGVQRTALCASWVLSFACWTHRCRFLPPVCLQLPPNWGFYGFSDVFLPSSLNIAPKGLLAVQWLRLLPMWQAQVQPLIRDLRSHCVAAKNQNIKQTVL